jgi:hypothetical protein
LAIIITFLLIILHCVPQRILHYVFHHALHHALHHDQLIIGHRLVLIMRTMKIVTETFICFSCLNETFSVTNLLCLGRGRSFERTYKSQYSRNAEPGYEQTPTIRARHANDNNCT